MNIVRTKLKDFKLSEKLKALSESARTTVAIAAISRFQGDSNKLDEIYESENRLPYDQFTSDSLNLFEAMKLGLSRYSHDSRIDSFLKECNGFVSDHSMHLMLERAIQRLSTSRDKAAFASAIDVLRKASNSAAPSTYVVENLASSRWIPDVNFIFTQALASVGSIDDKSSPFTVSKVLSVTEEIDGSTVFFSDGLVLESDGKSVKVSSKQPTQKSIDLQRVLESCRFDGDRVSCFPNRRTVISYDLKTNECFVNGSKADPTTLNSRLLANGLARLDEMSMVDHFMELVSESGPMTEIDFGYRVNSSNGKRSVSVYKVGGNVFVQRKDREMGNSIDQLGVNESIKEVREFMEYDITESVKDLLPIEDKVKVDNSAEIKKLEERIEYAEKKLDSLSAIEKSGTVNESNIEKARKHLSDIVNESKERITKLLLNEEATKVSVDDKGEEVKASGKSDPDVNAGEEVKPADKSVPEDIGEDGAKKGEEIKA